MCVPMWKSVCMCECVCVSEICMYGVSNGCVYSSLDISIDDRAM